MRFAPLSIPLAATLVLAGCPVPYDEYDEWGGLTFDLELVGTGAEVRGRFSVYEASTAEFINLPGTGLTLVGPTGSKDLNGWDGWEERANDFTGATDARLLDIQVGRDSRSGQLLWMDGDLIRIALANATWTTLLEDIEAPQDAAFVGDDVLILAGTPDDCLLQRVSSYDDFALSIGPCSGELLVDAQTETSWVAAGDSILEVVDDELAIIEVPADSLAFDPILGVLYAVDRQTDTVEALAKEEGAWSQLWSVETDGALIGCANLADSVAILTHDEGRSQVDVRLAVDGAVRSTVSVEGEFPRLSGSAEALVFALSDGEATHVMETFAPPGA